MFQPNPVTKTMLLCTTFANDNELKKFGEGCYVDLRIVCKTGPNGKQTPTQFVLTDIASGNDPSSFKMQKRDRTVVDVVITSKQSMGAGVLMKHDGSVDLDQGDVCRRRTDRAIWTLIVGGCQTTARTDTDRGRRSVSWMSECASMRCAGIS